MRQASHSGPTPAWRSGLAALAAYPGDISEIRNRVRNGASIAATACGPIEYASEGTGAPALISHGAGGGYDQGLLLARSFAPPGVRAIAPSRLGYLGTPLPADASPTAQAHAHAALLDALAVDSAIVVGVSAGAPSAVELALHHPKRVRALILAVPRGYAPDAPALPLTRSRRALLRLLLSCDLVYWSALCLAGDGLAARMGVPPPLFAEASDAERNRVAAMMRCVLPVGRRRPGLNSDATARFTPLPLERIEAPTLILATRDDPVETLPAAEFLAAGIAGSHLHVLDSGGHLFVGWQREVAAVVADFLAAISETKPAY
jgi:pimeloyl-ACP methyl ester carboxylesterase